jgi:sulfhydrogenase subunit beta (sulfur reductase)
MPEKMTAKAIEKSEFAAFVKAIPDSGYELYGPAGDAEEPTIAQIAAPADVSFDYRNFKMSPKDLFLPQSEVLCRFCRGEIVHDAADDDGKRVLLGIRPCDAKAISLMDKVFLQEPEDSYYKRKRDNTVVISAVCSRPEDTCFCTSVGGSPASPDGSDILLTDLGESYLLEPVTPKGEEFLGPFSSLMRNAKKNEISEKKRVAEEAAARMPKMGLEGIAKRFAEAFESDLWNTVSQKCLGCGICTYFCPTCHCFDVTDEMLHENGRRIRTWDSCMYSLFTLHASGHNPRPSQNERTRQRFMHKFSYSVDNFGELFCVGCGRCIKHCPVNIDLREVIAP